MFSRWLQVGWLLFLVLALLPACTLGGHEKQGALPVTIRLTSPAFVNGGEIPQKFTCDGENVSPPLAWNDSPAATRSLALTVDDPGAPGGRWTHWVAYNLPPKNRQMSENAGKDPELPGGGLQGRNSFRKLGYGGPCPPPGPAHRYFFKLYALDSPTGLKAGATESEVERAMQGHILAMGELMGRYGR